MKKLSDDLKRMLAGLAYQDAADYLPMHDKLDLLGVSARVDSAGKRNSSPSGQRRIVRRSALISDGRGQDAPLEYLLDSCGGEAARIDLLLHGPAAIRGAELMESRIRDRGCTSRRLSLDPQPIQSILDYVASHPSLRFLVGMPDDPLVQSLMENPGSWRGGHLGVPLVLIGE